LGTIFLIQTTLGAIFARIFRDFSRISRSQNFWGYAFTPRTLTSCTTAPGKSTFGPCLEKILPAPIFRGTCSSNEMLKGYMARESLGTPALNNALHLFERQDLGSR